MSSEIAIRSSESSVNSCRLLPRTKVSVLSRMYVWSIMFEPLLFFVVGSNTITGVGANVGRLLQILVVIGLLLRWLTAKTPLWIPNPANPLYKNYTCYFALAVLGAFIGIAGGDYTLDVQYNADYAQTSLASILRGNGIRPFFEYFIAFYYFVYFVVLPRSLLDSEEGIRYLFRVFTITFMVSLVVGAIDLMAVAAFRIDGLVPRHMSDGVMVGFRFHGLAGEPRDAFVYLLFGLATLTIREFWFGGKPLSRIWPIVITGAIVLTQSASGLMGLSFAGALILAFNLKYFSVRALVLSGVSVVVLAVLIYVGVHFSPRIQDYLRLLLDMFEILDRHEPIPALMSGQMSNIFPLWEIYHRAIHGEILPLLFGSGFGSASIINNNLGDWNELSNPHAQIVRTLYECGFVGLCFLIVSFTYPVWILTEHVPPGVRRRFLLFTLLLVGSFLAHRSATLFIYLGIFILVMRRSHARAEQQVLDAAAAHSLPAHS